MIQTDDLSPARYIEIVEELTELLRQEIDAVERGDVSAIETSLTRKRELLSQIEEASPALQADIPTDNKVARLLNDRLSALREVLEQDLRIVERMGTAARDLATELGRIRKRHGLAGTYSAKGHQKEDPLKPPARLDRSL